MITKLTSTINITMSKKVPDHFNVPIIVPIPNTVPLDP